MAYRIYHVEGIVLQSKPTGEGDALLFVYTRELGLVMVVAKSLRLAKSRLRFVLQRFAHAHLDLVRGKHGWRLTSARTISTQSALFRHPHRRRVLAAVTSMLMRLIHGEEPHGELFAELIEELERLETLETREDCYYFELFMAVRILRALGYWEQVATDISVFENTKDTQAMLAAIASMKTALIPRINAALHATQL
jgi:DNA repair protein RecO